MKLKSIAALAAVTLSSPLSAQLSDIRFGNLHAHTSYSDGLGTPAEAYTMACNAGLDFFAITEHNHEQGDGKGERRDGIVIATAPELYAGSPSALVETANALDRPGECVTIYGQEFSTISSGNHVNVFDVDEVIGIENGRFDLLLAWLDANPDGGGIAPLLQFNHPNSGKKAVIDYGRDDFSEGSELAWQQAMVPRTSLIEVFNAPALRDGERQRTTTAPTSTGSISTSVFTSLRASGTTITSATGATRPMRASLSSHPTSRVAGSSTRCASATPTHPRIAI